MSGAHKSPEFLKLNRFGQVPTLVDEATTVADSNAILVYLAKKLGKTDWLPEAPEDAATIQRWLSVAAGEIAYGPAAARLITVFGAKYNADEVIGRAHAILKLIDADFSSKAIRRLLTLRCTATSRVRQRETLIYRVTRM